MSIKQFFKPTIKKVVLFLGLATLTVYSNGAVEQSIVCFMAPCIQPFPYGDPFFTAAWNMLAFPFNVFVQSKLTAIRFLGIAVNIFYLYTIATISSTIINKMISHKPKQKNNHTRQQWNQ